MNSPNDYSAIFRNLKTERGMRGLYFADDSPNPVSHHVVFGMIIMFLLVMAIGIMYMIYVG